MPALPPDEAARVEYLETTSAHMSHAWDGLEEIRRYLYQTCQRGTVIKGADAAELYCAVEDVMRELDDGWLLVRRERARGTRVQVHPMFVPLLK